MPIAPTPRRAPLSLMSRLVCLAGAMTITAILASGCQSSKKPPLIQPRWATLPPKKVPEFLKGTIVELCDAANTEPQAVNNFGLVVNLKGTGDAYNVNNEVKDYVVKTMAKHGIGSARTPGLEGSMPDEWLRDPRNAIVRVDALIPAGARVGQQIDVAVSALPGSNTSSLAGGTLYQTDLKERGADPRMPGVGVKTPVVAEGQVFVNPVYALGDPNSDPTAKASLRFGTVLGGGLVQEDRAILLRIREPSLKMSVPYTWIEMAVPGPGLRTRWMSPGGAKPATSPVRFVLVPAPTRQSRTGSSLYSSSCSMP